MDIREFLKQPIRSADELMKVFDCTNENREGWQSRFRWPSHFRPLTHNGPVWSMNSNWTDYVHYLSLNSGFNLAWIRAKARWWQVREALRLGFIYPMIDTDVVATWNDAGRLAAGATFLHGSLEDHSRVAYTVDMASGETDRQRVVSFVRWLTTNVPSYWARPDEEFAKMQTDLVAAHTLELTLLPPEQIAAAYDLGPSSCMSGRTWPSTFGGNPPAEAYNYEGYQLAVIPNGTGGYSQRCLVWINPEKPEDKRYIRVYGSGPLEKRLLRNGFVKSGHLGAKLKRMPVEGARHGVICPYLDAAGGRNDGSYVVDRGDYLQVVNSHMGSRLRELDPMYAAGTGSAAGWIEVKRLPEDVEFLQDVVVGDRFSIFDNSTLTDVVMRTESGEVRGKTRLSHQALAEQGFAETVVWNAHRTGAKMTWARGYEVVYDHNWRSIANDDALLAELSVVRLSRELYPDEQYANCVFADHMTVATEHGVCLVVDAATVKQFVDGQWTTCFVHKSKLEKAKWRTVRDGYTVPRTTKVLKLVDLNGKTHTYVPGLHDDVVQLLDGTWRWHKDAISVNCDYGSMYLPVEGWRQRSVLPYLRDQERQGIAGHLEEPVQGVEHPTLRTLRHQVERFGSQINSVRVYHSQPGRRYQLSTTPGNGYVSYGNGATTADYNIRQLFDNDYNRLYMLELLKLAAPILLRTLNSVIEQQVLHPSEIELLRGTAAYLQGFITTQGAMVTREEWLAALAAAREAEAAAITAAREADEVAPVAPEGPADVPPVAVTYVGAPIDEHIAF